MIQYSRKWHFLRLRGSVAPHALRWAVPCSALAYGCHVVLNSRPHWSDILSSSTTQDSVALTLFMSILGFLLVFRAQQAYSRYWEGITLIERACGVWLNGYSNLFAFCSSAPEKRNEVDEFQYWLFQLMSLLLSCSFGDLTGKDRVEFQYLESNSLDADSTVYLEATSHKQYVVLQWLQRLVVEGSRSGVIDVSPPILSRVFQEFSIGIVHFIDAKKLAVVPFPFQFAQIVWAMMLIFSMLGVPVVCAVGFSNAWKASGYTFAIVFAYWSVHHMSIEIEMPFGEGPNDLPMQGIARRFNKVLARLLDAKAQTVPRLSEDHQGFLTSRMDRVHSTPPCTPAPSEVSPSRQQSGDRELASPRLLLRRLTFEARRKRIESAEPPQTHAVRPQAPAEESESAESHSEQEADEVVKLPAPPVPMSEKTELEAEEGQNSARGGAPPYSAVITHEPPRGDLRGRRPPPRRSRKQSTSPPMEREHGPYDEEAIALPWRGGIGAHPSCGSTGRRSWQQGHGGSRHL